LWIIIDSETMNRLSNIHPGEVLLQEFLIPMDITAYRLAKETFLPQTRVSAILKGKRSITADTALRFAKFFGTSAQFWLGLQVEFDLEEELRIHEDALRNIVPHAPNAT
jgi:addiction module HigA family antidote